MSNLKIGPVDITSGTAKLDAGGLQVGTNQIVANSNGSVTIAGGHSLKTNSHDIISSTTATYLGLDSISGQDRGVVFKTNGNGRWGIFSNTEVEGGANSGSNFAIIRYADNGNYIDAPMVINRATGQVGFYTSVVIPSLDVNANDGRAASTSFVKASFGVVPDRPANDSTSNAANTRFVQDAIAQRSASPKGRVIWTTPGTYTWTAPIGVTEIFVDGSAGGGGAAVNVNRMGNGGRGESCYRYLVSVTPGTSYTVIVGSKGESISVSPYVVSSAGSGGSTAIVGKLTLAGGGGARVIGMDSIVPGINKYPIDVSPTFTLSDGRIAGMGGISVSGIETVPATDGFLLITW